MTPPVRTPQQNADTVREDIADCCHDCDDGECSRNKSLAALAALVAQAEAAAQRQHQCQFPSCVDGEKPPLCGHCGDAERAEAAEARLAQTQDALRLACADLQDLHAKFLDNRRGDYEPPDDGDVTRLMGEMIARAALTGEGTEPEETEDESIDRIVKERDEADTGERLGLKDLIEEHLGRPPDEARP